LPGKNALFGKLSCSCERHRLCENSWIFFRSEASGEHMSHIRGVERNQVQLLPAAVEDYVGRNASVRAIEAFVGGLDLRELGFSEAPATTGRPSYDPADLLGLYLYGYLHRIRSSRRLEAECQRNLELIWLLGGLSPDHWTIAAFRREHSKRFKGVFREFNLLCRKLELFGAELVAIDGAKFKAVNSPRRHYTKEQLQELVTQIDTRIAAYLEQLDKADDEQAGVPERAAKDLPEKLAQLKDRQARYKHLEEALAAAEETEISLTDPDSRGQKKVGVGYNVQVAVDAKHDLIVEAEVVQDQNDLAQLPPMATAAAAALEQTPQFVADAGYHEAGQLEKCEKAGLETYVPASGGTSGQAPGGVSVYPKSDFTYHAELCFYRCPAGQELRRGYSAPTRGKERDYYYNVAACGACALRNARPRSTEKYPG
jgi:transposase